VTHVVDLDLESSISTGVDASLAVHLSAASVWELAIKAMLGKVDRRLAASGRRVTTAISAPKGTQPTAQNRQIRSEWRRMQYQVRLSLLCRLPYGR
jgi:PIN domain nuclease of toxin-antitoxin system